LTYKAIVFDLGQVVFSAGFNKRYSLLCDKYHIKSDESVFKEFRDIWNKAKIGEIDSEEFFSAIANKLHTSSDEVKKVLIESISLNEKIRDLILKLSERYKIGILTNNIKEFYEADLNLWNFEEIGEVVASFKVGVAKPDLKAIELILEKLNLEKEDIIFVDDHNETTSKYNKLGIRSITYDGYDELIINLKNWGIEL
jgi:epoxide hydrolase-like predicted phosphatase